MGHEDDGSCHLRLGVDGTLVEVSSIRHYVTDKTRNFDKFHCESVNCPPNQWVVDALHEHQKAGKAILIVTARQFRYAMHTMFWLKFAGIDYDQLYMRRTGDFRPDAVVKSEILEMIKADHYFPVLAYDDRADVAAVWASAGIPTEMVA